ncbi:MAG: hypothetical protein NVSMB9_03400 [Isosphaeraceae bacterium]
MIYPGLNTTEEKPNNGHDEATAQFFRAYEPYLRMVVRRKLTPRLRTRFDSHDVVQSVWAETLARLREGRADWCFKDEQGLKSFLVRITLNRFIDFYRRHRVSLEREEPFSPGMERRLASVSPRVDRPSEVAQADELWGQLMALCPPAHHELLRLKTLGLPIAEIAARTGYHESSVRRILYELAERLDAETMSRPSVPRS